MDDHKAALKEYLKALLFTLGAALFLRIFVVQAFRIPTGSMKDTLLIGDFLLVNKFVYGTRTPDRLLGTEIVLPSFRLPRIRRPRRGEVVVFKYPQDTRLDYIKRCMGLPGDTLEMRDGRLFINGLPEGIEEFVGKKYDEEEQATYDYYRLTGERGTVYTLRRRSSRHGSGDFGPVVVPPGHYFMMGDNRDNSFDSRSWGFLPEELIVGKAMIIYFSYDQRRQPPSWNLLRSIRWDRLLRPIR